MPRSRAQPGISRRAFAGTLIAVLLVSIASSEDLERSGGYGADWPDAEFHMARMIYDTRGCGGSRGNCNPWWAVDYPEAEWNFLPALRRMTMLSVADDSRHLPVTDDRIFDYPWLFIQQVARGNWRPSYEEVERLREYLNRGGFLVVDDFHGEREWRMFESVIRAVLPGRAIVDIPDSDPLMSIVYELDTEHGIPGARHVRGGQVRLQGPPTWRGIYDDHGRLMVAINLNADMGDSWEHADDPLYPAPMTALAYRFGVNYVVYAMTR
jgi:hypothetical protein